MYQIKEEFKSNNSNRETMHLIRINMDDEVIEINTNDNSNMDYETFKKLVDNGYATIFDFSKRILAY